MRLAVCVLLGAEMCVYLVSTTTHTNTGPSAFSRPSITAESLGVPLPEALRTPPLLLSLGVRSKRHISSLPPRLMSTHDRSFSNALNPMVGVLEKPHT